MPRVVHILGDEPRDPVQQVINLEPDPSVAWTLDPFAPVDEKFRHLVNNPNESNSHTDAQEEAQ